MKKNTVSLRPLDWALIDFYCHKYNLQRGEVLGQLLEAYAEADKRFDVKEFKRYAEGTAIPGEEEPDLREVLERQLKTFVGEHGK
jgi:hypothetical protein